ncbi:hypothetical protein SAMN06297251_10178 [Fulvimarina manganoxydans]|uniref:Phage integrase family protein n=1 Tax=Fulvimarina manganoxydans TaxID=937218 RepID=A0A1W1YAF2_9HYPH|nr:hypothetical protein [Fulvimarina manganoxydans]SMC32728.1 hypothetical protein SAMN06297251_10178 [Fulvimarina manganoxydans]
MPRRSAPARLWLFRPKTRAGVVRQATWYVKHGDKRFSTGCLEDDRAGAEAALADYLVRAAAEEDEVRDRRAGEVRIDDVISHYAAEKASVARPRELGARLGRLLDYWGEMTLDEVNARTCKAYARQRSTVQAARRELEDLRAAIRLYASEGLCREIVVVWVPEKAQAREGYLTRDQAASLLWHLWKTRAKQGNKKTTTRTLKHVAPFVLMGIYTGTRSSRIWKASFVRQPGHPWIDVENGVYYRAAPREIVARNKRAGAIRIPGRLLVHLRRWARERDYLVEYRGKPANPKKALYRAFDDVFGDDHDFVVHSLRHTCATWLMWSGGNVDDIASFLSMSRKILLEVYGHHHPDAHRLVGDLFMKKPGDRKAS